MTDKQFHRFETDLRRWADAQAGRREVVLHTTRVTKGGRIIPRCRWYDAHGHQCRAGAVNTTDPFSTDPEPRCALHRNEGFVR